MTGARETVTVTTTTANGNRTRRRRVANPVVNAGNTVGMGQTRSARRRRRRRMLGMSNPVGYVATRNQARPQRRMRQAGNRAMDRLREQDALRSLDEGAMSAVGPGTNVGAVWKRGGVSAPEVGGLVRNIMGCTEDGRRAGVKMLHPACELGAQRWPDKAASKTVVKQATDVFTLTAPPEEGDNYDYKMTIWLTPFADVPVISAGAKHDAEWPNPNVGMNSASCSENRQTSGKPYTFHYSLGWDNASDQNHPSKDYQTVRLTSRSITCDLIANATSNQGVIYASLFGPDLARLPGGTGVSEPLVDIVREVSFLMLKDMLTIADRNRGKLPDDYDTLPELDKETVADLITKFDKMTFGKRDLGVGPSGDQTGFRLCFQDFPYNPQQVMQVSPGSYMAKASEGIYMPLKTTQDMLPFTETAYECYLSAKVPHNDDKQTSEKNVLGTEGWGMGAILFDGVAKTSSIVCKVISTYEFTPRSDSQLAQFAEEAPALDKPAQDHVRAAMGNLPDAYPARDNVLGDIVEWIAGALEKAKIPIVSSVAGFARSMNDATGRYATNALNRVF